MHRAATRKLREPLGSHWEVTGAATGVQWAATGKPAGTTGKPLGRDSEPAGSDRGATGKPLECHWGSRGVEESFKLGRGVEL